MLASLLLDLNFVVPQTAFLVGQSAIDQLFQLLNPQRLELENLRARDERAIYIKERIVGRRADEPQISALDVRQEDVLLRFVEMMDLIDEYDRLSSRCPDA